MFTYGRSRFAQILILPLAFFLVSSDLSAAEFAYLTLAPSAESEGTLRGITFAGAESLFGLDRLVGRREVLSIDELRAQVANLRTLHARQLLSNDKSAAGYQIWLTTAMLSVAHQMAWQRGISPTR